MTEARKHPGVLYANDRELIDAWAAHGIPDHRSSQEHAAKMLGRLLAALDQAWDLMDELFDREQA